MSSKTLFDLTRVTRTAASEVHLIWRIGTGIAREGQIGHLDLHLHNEVFYATIVLVEELTDDELDALRNQVDHQLCDPVDRVDFICSVYQGEQIWEFSDKYDWSDRSGEEATVADIREVQSSLAKVLGRHQSLRGKITEHAVTTYFESLAYTARRGGPELDALKVDVVAESSTEVVYAQVKLGAIAGSEMRKIVASVASIPKTDGRDSAAAIIANTFPMDSEIRRRRLEKDFGISVMCIQLYQVVAAVPEYRHPLGVNEP